MTFLLWEAFTPNPIIFFDRMGDLSDYAKGYLDGLMICQRNVQGYNFVQECIEPVLEELSQALPMEPNVDGAETKEFLFCAVCDQSQDHRTGAPRSFVSHSQKPSCRSFHS